MSWLRTGANPLNSSAGDSYQTHHSPIFGALYPKIAGCGVLATFPFARRVIAICESLGTAFPSGNFGEIAARRLSVGERQFRALVPAIQRAGGLHQKRPFVQSGDQDAP